MKEPPFPASPVPQGSDLIGAGGKDSRKALKAARKTICRMLDVLGYASDPSHNFAVGACLDRMREIRDMNERLAKIKTHATLRP